MMTVAAKPRRNVTQAAAMNEPALWLSAQSPRPPSPQAILQQSNASAIAGEMILAVSSGVKTTQKVKLWKLSWTLFGLGRGGVI
jgi:hypothetical protein